ncbi:MAG: hypothetical protein GY952_17215 [Rhodobacteraceae bacterium]|nr:hypothetical protein [Paracoccaceae bacterium]
MGANVVPLNPNEEPWIHQDAIRVLQDSLGVDCSRDVVERAVFEISDRLCRLELAFHDGRLDEVGKLAGSLVGMSTQIGLLVFANVAASLCHSVQCENHVTAAAQAARLLRLGESSLFCAVEIADRSG